MAEPEPGREAGGAVGWWFGKSLSEAPDPRRPYEEALHPRDRRGEFARKGFRASVGVTPFRPEDDPEGFEHSEKWRRFQAEMRDAARQYGVQIQEAHPAKGVWEGETEPSIAAEVEDGREGVRAWAAQLGRDFDQDGVLLFAPDENGNAASYFFDGADKEADTFLEAMGKHGIPGARVLPGGVEIIGEGEDFASKIDALAADTGHRYSWKLGNLELLERGEGYESALEAVGEQTRPGG